ncbi:MAG: SpaA isopeptide-forming pilin-related protein [Actinomycetia bacterium]|nr:SpaA isopeptide-forming pilin-related protein [Actinomycetes bacterium]
MSVIKVRNRLFILITMLCSVLLLLPTQVSATLEERSGTEHTSPAVLGWELGDERIEIFESEDVDSFRSLAESLGIMPLAIDNGNPPATIRARMKMPVDPDWAHATLTDGDYPNARLSIISGYAGKDWDFGYSKPYNMNNIHCIDPGLNAPAKGAEGDVTFTLNEKLSNDKYYVYYGYGYLNRYQDYYNNRSRQRMATYIRIPRVSQGYIAIKKKSAYPNITNSNACYVMDGICYYAYDSRADAVANEDPQAAIFLDGNGNGQSKALAYGSYFVKEAPKGKWKNPARASGYKPSNTITKVVIDGDTPLNHDKNQAVELELTDSVFTASVGLVVQKLDAVTGKASTVDDPNGAKLAGAQFAVRYWDGYYSTVAAAQASGAPTRTWVVETKVGGKAELNDNYLIAGSSQPYSIDGLACLPLGTVVIQETKAPGGYLLPTPNNPSIQNIKLNNDLDTVSALNPVSVPEQPRAVEVRKINASSKAPLAGAQFKLMRESSPGKGDWAQLYATKTSDSLGKIAWSPVEPGSYKIVEVVAPKGYLLPSAVGGANEQFLQVSNTANTPTTTISFGDYADSEIKVDKLDADSQEPVADTEFCLLSYPVKLVDGSISSDVTKIAADDTAWQEVARRSSGPDGRLSFQGLPFGYYQIVEACPNPAYMSYEEGGGTPRFVKLDKHYANEVQIFEDHKIEVSVEIFKDTINQTSAAFRTDEHDSLAINNIGKEQYHYDLNFRSTSNVRADEFCVIDPLEMVVKGQARLTELFTPVTWGDTDGKFNLWYQTNLTAADKVYSQANAMITNPANPNNPKNQALWPSTGWRLWRQDIPSTKSVELHVSDLDLALGEYVSSLRFEYGSVEVGFTSNNAQIKSHQNEKVLKPLEVDWTPSPEDHFFTAAAAAAEGLHGATYLVSCPARLVPPERMENSATVYLARNLVLTAEDTDAVVTTVIQPFMIEAQGNPLANSDQKISYGKPVAAKAVPESPDVPEKTERLAGSFLPVTGDFTAKLLLVAMAVCLFAAAAMICMARRKKKSGNLAVAVKSQIMQRAMGEYTVEPSSKLAAQGTQCVREARGKGGGRRA